MALGLLLLPVFAQNPEDNPDIFGEETEEGTTEADDNSPETAGVEKKASFPRMDEALEDYDLQGSGFLVPSDEIKARKKVKYIIRISWEGDQDIIEVDEPEDLDLTNFNLRKMVPSHKYSPETNRSMVEFTYHIRAGASGVGFIGTADGVMRLQDGAGSAAYRIPGQSVTITARTFHFWRFVLIFIIVIIILAIIAGLVFLGIKFMNRPRKVQPATAYDNDVTTPYERILGEIASMKLFLVEGEIRDFYSKLTKLAKGFVAVTEGEEITRQTTDELLQTLKDRDYNPENRDKIFAILEMCDRVKYAGYIPTKEENQQILKDFESLVRSHVPR